MRSLLRPRLGTRFNEGARQLWREIERRGMSQADADAALGTSAGQVNRILYGERKPGRGLAERIRLVFGISPTLWDEAPAEDFVPPAGRTGTEG